jgi:hypothetical protein
MVYYIRPKVAKKISSLTSGNGPRGRISAASPVENVWKNRLKKNEDRIVWPRF